MLYNRGIKKPRSSIFGKNNPYLEHNINLFIKLEKNNDFIFPAGQIDDSFDRHKELQFICKKCNRKIKMSLFNMLRGTIYSSGKNDQHRGLICQFCDGKRESMHANILKQIFLHEFPNTVLEDKSCRNPLTNAILPTDIVNHDLKIAIEIQSVLHDREYQKIKDKIKRDYWIDNGYSFYDYFIEDYSIIEYIQLFFPQITDIPDYIKSEFNGNLDVIKAQELLDSGYTVREVSSIMNVNIHRIYDSIYSNKLYYPDGYKKDNTVQVVMLDKYKNYVKTYQNYTEASIDNGIANGNIASCISSKYYYANGYYWIPLKDYKSGNYVIPDNRLLKFESQVIAYTKNNEFIKMYDSILDASKDLGIISYKIWQVAEHKRKSCKGYIFEYITS